MKRIIIIGLLLISPPLISIIKANSSSLKTILFTPPENLSDKLVSDKDFQQLELSLCTLTNKLQTTKSFKLFESFFKKQINDFDLQKLLVNLDFKNKEELVNYCKSLFSLKVNVQQKFPEVAKEESKSEIELAVQKMMKSEQFATISLRPLTCYEWYTVTLLNLCTIGCYAFEDYDACWWPCFDTVTSLWLLCELTED